MIDPLGTNTLSARMLENAWRNVIGLPRLPELFEPAVSTWKLKNMTNAPRYPSVWGKPNPQYLLQEAVVPYFKKLHDLTENLRR